ncbi:MAG TPA: methionine synthase [Candidatus Dormibacteraeota bacterium]|nr:methionine synthase [Candidatus Dormibacteraeota bacterium]
MFETTIVGSLPKPFWLAETNRLWPQWRWEGDQLRRAQRDAVTVMVALQERAGIDVVTDGEMGRRHFVHGFLERIEGVDFSRLVRDFIRDGRYQADLPTVVAPVRRSAPVHVDDVRHLRASTQRPIKLTIPGPMTMVDTLHDEAYGDRRTLAFALAEIVNQEILDLVEAGLDVVQLDEPAFNVYLDEVEEWGIAALDRALAGVRCRTAVHVCYGYGIEANIAWKQSLGAVWDHYRRVLPALESSRVDELSIECAGSCVPIELLGLVKKKRVAVGAVDVASDRVETPEEVVDTVRRVLEYVPRERIALSTNCGMAPMERSLAEAKLATLGAGAVLARVRFD